jgi:hypothetical protein
MIIIGLFDILNFFWKKEATNSAIVVLKMQSWILNMDKNNTSTDK